MAKTDQISVTRRTLLQVVTVGSGVLLGSLIPTSANAAAPLASAGAAVPVAGQTAGTAAFTDIQGVWAEYGEAIANFPLALPEGWSFPAESAMRNSEPDVQWEVGCGNTEAYLCWQRAVATAAHEAHQRGDHDEADRLLDLLEAGYDSPTRRAVIKDPDNAFLAMAVRPARSADGAARGSATGGDFSTLMDAVRVW